jgi:hypothetical protein
MKVLCESNNVPILQVLPHGTKNVTHGKLILQTDTDYLVAKCPRCGGKMLKSLNGIYYRQPILSLSLTCRVCGLHDHCKIGLGPFFY